MTHGQLFPATSPDTSLQNSPTRLPISFPSPALQAAACAKPGVNPDDFFPPVDSRGWRNPTRREQTAKRFCVACPVRRSCLVAALRRKEPYGIFGGLTAAERRHLSEIHSADSVRGSADSESR